MKQAIYQQLTDAINNIKDARNPYDAGEITEHQAKQAINNAKVSLELAYRMLEETRLNKEDN